MVIGTCSLYLNDSNVISWNCSFRSFLEEFWRVTNLHFWTIKYHFNSFDFNLGSITCTWHNALQFTMWTVEKRKIFQNNNFWGMWSGDIVVRWFHVIFLKNWWWMHSNKFTQFSHYCACAIVCKLILRMWKKLWRFDLIRSVEIVGL